MRKYENLKDSDMTIQEFLESLDSEMDFSIRLHFPNVAKVNLDPLTTSDSIKFAQSTIGIEDCLERFRIEELLKEDNKYYCRECKDHQETWKKMDIYRLPKLLVIQLKRFSKDGEEKSKYGGISRMMRSSKNSDLIDFPIEGLDMGKYLLDKPDGKDYLYDLYAISNHMGSLYGGHYTAHCKNSLNDKWYYYNDSSCGPVSKKDLVCSSAYVLFYRLRE